MTFRDQLEEIGACKESLEWVGDKTIEQAWLTCENSKWMLWVLTRTDLDLVDPVYEIVEEVLDLVPEECQLACIWSISAAKRRASKEELNAAYDAAYSAASYAYACNNSRAVADAAVAAADLAYAYGSNTSYYYAAASAYAASTAAFAEMEEQKKQCDILRKYITIEQVREAFNKLVA